MREAIQRAELGSFQRMNEIAFAGKKELDRDEDGVPKWADKDDSDPDVGSEKPKKKTKKKSAKRESVEILRAYVNEVVSARAMGAAPEQTCDPAAAAKIEGIFKSESQKDPKKAMRELLQGLMISADDDFNAQRIKDPSVQAEKIVTGVKTAAFSAVKGGAPSIPPPPSGPAPVATFESRKISDHLFGSLLREGVEIYDKFCTDDLKAAAIKFSKDFVEKYGKEDYEEIYDLALQGVRAGWYGIRV